MSEDSQETIIDKLNCFAKESGYNNIPPYATEYIGFQNGETSTTPLFNKQSYDAFTLNPVVAGKLKIYQRPGIYQVPEDYVGLVGIHRALIGHYPISRIQNILDMQKILSPIINLGVQDLINQFGNLMFGYRITMEYPGQNNTYIKECDNAAAYEIRLTLYKE